MIHATIAPHVLFAATWPQPRGVYPKFNYKALDVEDMYVGAWDGNRIEGNSESGPIFVLHLLLLINHRGQIGVISLFLFTVQSPFARCLNTNIKPEIT